jgi:putative addiction module antidote
LTGDVDTGKAVLRDYINATIGFGALGTATDKSPKSLMRMFGPKENPLIEFCNNKCYNTKYSILQEEEMLALKLRKIGNSLGVVLPKEALASLKADEGDVIYLTDSPDGGFRITPLNEGFADQFKQAERIMREDRDVLRELAKR